MQVERFDKSQNADSIGERRRAQGDRRRRPAPARPAARDDRKEGERPSSVGCAATFPQGGRQELAPPVIPIEGVQPPLCHPERAKRAEGSLKTILAQAKSHFCANAPNLRSSARAGKVKPRHFYSKQFSKNGKITLLPFFPYEQTDGGECGAHKKWRAPKGAPQRGETAASTAKPRARQVSPLVTKFCFISLKQNL